MTILGTINERRAFEMHRQSLGLRTEAENVIRPIVPRDITEQDISLAKQKFITEQLLNDIADVAYIQNFKTVEEVKQQLENILEYENDNFKHYTAFWDKCDLTNELDSWHSGDCTARAFTCMRCYAEAFFGFQTCPPSKSVGAKTFSQYNKEKQNNND